MQGRKRRQIIPWKRFWRPFGTSVQLGEEGQGFLPDPDDDFARFYNPHVFTIDQLLSEKCVILCGEPGSGKSTALEQARIALAKSLGADDHILWLDFRDVPNEGVFSRRTFESDIWRNWHSSTGNLLFVVDSVDEGQFKVPNFVSFLASELRVRKVPFDRLRIILVCRSADWPESEGQRLIGLWAQSEKPHVFELCPLRHSDAVLAAQIESLDAANFIRCIYDKKVVGLAAIPTTLLFLLAEFTENGLLSSSHRDLYERGCRRLARENDPERISARRAMSKSAHASTPDRIFEAAAFLAALLFTCGKSAIYIGPATDADEEGDLHLSEAVDDTWTENLLLNAVGSGLFTSRGTNRFGFAHQTFAECLAAHFLSGLPHVQMRKILCSRDADVEHVIPQLAEICAWIAGVKSEFFDYLCQIEPEVLLRSDVSKVQNTRKGDLVLAILEKAKREELFDERSLCRFFDGLNHPDIANRLRPYVVDKSLNLIVRRMAIEIAGECNVSDLFDDLLRMVYDTIEEQQLREQAAHSLETVTPKSRLAELIPLATGQIEDDPNDNIRGCAVRRLVPEYWSVSEAMPHLHAPRNEFYFGSYKSVLKYHLARHLTDNDLPTVLEALIVKTRCFAHVNAFEDIALMAFEKVLESLSNNEFRKLAVRVWTMKSKNNHPLPGAKLFDERPEIRRKFIAAIINDPDVSTDDLKFQINFPWNAQEDLEWALDQISTVPVERQDAWAIVIANHSYPEAACKCWDKLLQRIAEIPAITATLSWVVATSDFDDPVVKQRMALWQDSKKRRDAILKPKGALSLEARLRLDFEKIAAGQTSYWISLCHDLALTENDFAHFFPLNHNLMRYPGWEKADDERRNLIRSAARQFILNHSDGYAEIGARTNFSDPGYIAIWLLRNEIRNDLGLKEAIASNWIRAIVGNFGVDSDHYQEMVALAYELGADKTLDAFIQELKEHDKKQGQIPSLHNFQKIWNDRFSSGILDLVRNAELRIGSVVSILEFTAEITPIEAAASAQFMLQSLAANDERKVALLTVCLGTMPMTTWDFVWPLFLANSGLAEEIVMRIANRWDGDRKKCLPLLTTKQLADLYFEVHRLFPPETDPDAERGGNVTPRQRIAYFRAEILGVLEVRGTDDACNELLRLARILPRESLWLRWRYYNARRIRRRKLWMPPKPKVALVLFKRRESRLVDDEGDLIDVIVESLERFQNQLTHSTLPRSEVFWHWEGADPKRRNFHPRDEAFLSDEIARWLHEDLGERGVVINREVQPRRGQRTDIYVSAITKGDADPIQSITAVIEIKGCWNNGVLTAVATQLVGDYLRPNGLTHGIYLVGWFVCDKWDKPLNKLASQTFADAQKELAQLGVAYDGKVNPERVRTIVLDCRYP